MFSFKKLGTALALLAAAATVNAQSIPTCAQPCVGSLLGGQGGGPCGPQDGKCICSNKELISNLACCVFQKCDPGSQDATVKFAKNICNIFHVQGTIPDHASCPAGASGDSSGSSSGGSSSDSILNVSTILAPGPVVTAPTSGYTSPSTLVVPSAYGGSVSINTAEYASQASENSAMASSSSAMMTGSGSSTPMMTGSGSSAAATSTSSSSSAPAATSTGAAARHEFGAAGALVAAIGGLAAML